MSADPDLLKTAEAEAKTIVFELMTLQVYELLHGYLPNSPAAVRLIEAIVEQAALRGVYRGRIQGIDAAKLALDL